MKSYELQPTRENIIKTFSEDKIGRSDDVFDFATLLESIEDNCSIALEGYWGSGKTFFVKQTKMLLEAYNEFSTMDSSERDRIKEYESKFEFNHKVNQVCVYYDAWLNDNDSDPILSLAYTILDEFESEYDFKSIDFNLDSFRKALNNIIRIKTGGIIKEGIPNIFSSTDGLSEIKWNNYIKGEFNSLLNSVLVERGDRIVIFIDELDRCSPDYAVKFLERIKHYFNNESITFVFSINISQLQHTIKKYYGTNFDASRYLDRFFDLRVSLPKADMNKFYSTFDFYSSKNDNESQWNNCINEAVIKTYSFELREISKYLRMINMATGSIWKQADEGDNIKNDYLHLTRIFVPVILGLRIYESGVYHDFMAGQNSQPLKDVFHNCEESLYIFEELITTQGITANYNATRDEIDKVVDSTIDKLYSFVFKESDEKQFVNVGKVRFSNWSKKQMLKDISLISCEID